MYAHNHGCNTNLTHAAFVRKAPRPGHGGHPDGRRGLRQRLLRQVHERPRAGPGLRRAGLAPLGRADRRRRRCTTSTARSAGSTPTGCSPTSSRPTRCDEFVVAHAGPPVVRGVRAHRPARPVHAERGSTSTTSTTSRGIRRPSTRRTSATSRRSCSPIPRQDRHRMQRIWEGKLEELRDVDDQVRDLVRTLCRHRSAREHRHHDGLRQRVPARRAPPLPEEAALRGVHGRPLRGPRPRLRARAHPERW